MAPNFAEVDPLAPHGTVWHPISAPINVRVGSTC